MQLRLKTWALSVIMLSCIIMKAQDKELVVQQPKLTIAVLAPIYLDSAFDGPNYKLGNNNLPKQILPGLDFYNGIMLAADSLKAENASLEILVFDTKSKSLSIDSILKTAAMQEAGLIIAAFNNKPEIKPVADFALSKNIPLISMTYPNDGGILNNPNYFLVNPTLKTHIEAIYKYLRRNYLLEPIRIFKRKGAGEDIIANAFTEFNKKTPGVPLKIKTTELSDSFSAEQVFKLLDSSKQNILLCASLNEAFGMSLVNTVESNPYYKAITIGMPTWDAIKEISKEADIIYTTPYNYPRTGKLGTAITNNYRNKYFGRPSDMVFKGFEALYHFGKLYMQYNQDLINHLSDNSNKLFNEYDFQPVMSKKEGLGTDYMENKKLYFIRKSGALIKSVSSTMNTPVN